MKDEALPRYGVYMSIFEKLRSTALLGVML